VPGVLSLDEPEIMMYSGFPASGPHEGAGQCWGGGGSFQAGTVEIVSIDDARGVVRLQGTSTFDVDANGEHTAARCP
jgi:hypothetical protein